MTAWRWLLLFGSGLLVSAWYPWSQSPGIDGKFLAQYLWGLLIIAYLVGEGLSSRLTLPRHRIALVLIGIILAGTALSAILSGNWLTFWGSGNHREGLATTLLYVLTLVAFAHLASRIRLRDLGAVVGVAFIVNGLIGFSPSGSRSAEFFGGRFVGSFAEPSFVAGFLILAIPLALYLAYRSPSILVKTAGALVSLLAVFELIVSQSRAGYLALAVMVVVFALLNIQKDRRKALYSLLATVLLFVPLLTERFSPGSLQTGVAKRLLTWEPVLSTGRFVLVGAGPDQFRAASHNQFLLWSAHNTFINEATDAGWAAAIAFFALILVVLVLLYRKITTESGGDPMADIILFTAIFGYMFFSFGNYTRPYVNLWFWMLLGIALGRTAGTRMWRPPRAVALGAVLLAVLFGLSTINFTGRYLLAANSYHAYLQVAETDSIEDHWRPLDRAVDLDPTNEIYREARARVALELMKLYWPDIEQLSFVRSHLVADWEFLYLNVYNDRQTYKRLTEAYRFVGVDSAHWLPEPEE